MNPESWLERNIPDLGGKTVIITGANSGIGFESARMLSNRRATVILACKSQEKGEDACKRIRNLDPDANVIASVLDLADLTAIRRFASEVLSKHDQIDVLINNAGVMAVRGYRKTADGFERQVGINHLGHFALTALLYPVLKDSAGSRIVTVSSQAHWMALLKLQSFAQPGFYLRWNAYGVSKLANLLFTSELHHRIQESDGEQLSVACHPGYASTNLQRTTPLIKWLLNPTLAQSAAMGALPVVYAAASKDVRSGDYVGPRSFFGFRGYPAIVRYRPTVDRRNLSKRLWKVSEELTGINFTV